jgi:hypothetical protein
MHLRLVIYISLTSPFALVNDRGLLKCQQNLAPVPDSSSYDISSTTKETDTLEPPTR